MSEAWTCSLVEIINISEIVGSGIIPNNMCIDMYI